jgi:hypothetical protein
LLQLDYCDDDPGHRMRHKCRQYLFMLLLQRPQNAHDYQYQSLHKFTIILPTQHLHEYECRPANGKLMI